MLDIGRAARRKSRLVAGEHQVYRKVRIRTKSFEYGYCQRRNLSGEPMRVSASLPQMGADMRPVVCDQKRAGSRQQRYQEQARARSGVIPPVSGLGLRGNMGVTALAVLALVVMGFGLWSHTRVTGAQKNVNDLATQVERSRESLESARIDYEGSKASIDVAYNARNLGLVSGKSIKAITLYAPEEATCSPADATPVSPRETLATILGY